MDIKQLKYFLTIANEGSISKAADILHMAQPPLSQQLKALENELGVTLFERNTRNMKLTDVGEKLIYRATQILNLVELTTREIIDLTDGLDGTLSIGTVSSAGVTFLYEIINNFHKKYNHINFEIIDEDTYSIINLLKNRSIDIGIIRTPFDLEDFEYIYLPSEPLVIASTKKFWKDDLECIDLKDFIGEDLLVPIRYKESLSNLCNKYDFEPRIVCKSNDIRTILLFCESGLGSAIIPKDCLKLIPNCSLNYIEINEPSLNVGTAIIWSKKQYISSVARRFISYLQNFIK
jgi:DNA-binding transcriptional LysR family regulator